MLTPGALRTTPVLNLPYAESWNNVRPEPGCLHGWCSVNPGAHESIRSARSANMSSTKSGLRKVIDNFAFEINIQPARLKHKPSNPNSALRLKVPKSALYLFQMDACDDVVHHIEITHMDFIRAGQMTFSPIQQLWDAHAPPPPTCWDCGHKDCVPMLSPTISTSPCFSPIPSIYCCALSMPLRRT